MSETPKCELCGEPMPVGEEMFKFHGYSGPCPKPPLPRLPAMSETPKFTPEELREESRGLLFVSTERKYTLVERQRDERLGNMLEQAATLAEQAERTCEWTVRKHRGFLSGYNMACGFSNDRVTADKFCSNCGGKVVVLQAKVK